MISFIFFSSHIAARISPRLNVFINNLHIIFYFFLILYRKLDLIVLVREVTASPACGFSRSTGDGENQNLKSVRNRELNYNMILCKFLFYLYFFFISQSLTKKPEKNKLKIRCLLLLLFFLSKKIKVFKKKNFEERL